MQLSLAEAEDLPLSGSTTLSLGPQAVVLRIDLDDDEILEDVDLRLVRATETPVPSVTTHLTSDAATPPFTDLTWLAAELEGTRAVERLTLSFAAKPDPLVVRLKIARGSSSWYPPPGPHSFTMGDSTTLTAAFPNTVADRLMLEMFTSGEVPTEVTLAGTTPLSLTYGQHARDVAVGISGRRRFLRMPGPAPTGEGLRVEGLFEHLRKELGDELRGQSIALELVAEVAGTVTLEWTLSSSRIEGYFAPDRDEDAFEVGWDEALTHPLPLSSDGPLVTPSEILSLDLQVTATHRPERVVLSPAASPPPVARGQLVRPFYDAAQALRVADPRPLAGVDVYARTLGPTLRLRAALHPDHEGRPAATPAIELLPPISPPGTTPGWISFALAQPVPVPPAPYWLVLAADEGELSWLLEAPRPAQTAALVFRRDAGSWLTRDLPGDRPWAMTRLRVLDATPPTLPTLTLLGYTEPTSTEPTLNQPLPIADDGLVHWTADPTSPPTLARLELRFASTVAATVTLTALSLRHRPVVVT